LYGERFKRRDGWEWITDASSPVREAVAYESDVNAGAQVIVLF